MPVTVLGALMLAIYFTVAAVYVPQMFSSYATRYGAIGPVLAMISALFALMVVVLACAAVCREVSVELGRIRRGERRAEGEIRREWDAFIGHGGSGWQAQRGRLDRRQRDDQSPTRGETERGR